MYRKSDDVIRRPLSVTIDDPDPFAGPRSLFPETRTWRVSARIVRTLGRFFLKNPIHPGGRTWTRPDSPLRQFLRGLAIRLALIPFLLGLVVCVLVYAATHPRVEISALNPAWEGLTYKSVKFSSRLGTPVGAWVTAPPTATGQKSPGVILIPGYGATRAQILPLVKPLHDLGFVQMVLAVRGQETGRPLGRTFGLTESADVVAALDELRRMPDVDGNRIAIIGLDIGANAAILAAQSDPSVAALVLDDPLSSGDAAIQRYVLLRIGWLRWLSPFCKFAFGAAYGLDIDQINLDRHTETIHSRRCLFVDDLTGTQSISPSQVDGIVRFLHDAFKPAGAEMAQALHFTVH